MQNKACSGTGFCVGFCRLFSEGPGLLLMITAGNVCGVKYAEFYGTIAAEINNCTICVYGVLNGIWEYFSERRRARSSMRILM